ncbi:hypothetical protein Tco_0888429, partial [Tanacetum coccineum]
GVENRYMVTLVNGVPANGVVMIFKMDIAFYAIQGTEILSLMIRLRILSIILLIFHTHLHNPNTCHTLDVQNVKEELAEDINTLNWDRPAFYYDDDDDVEESSIPLRYIIISGLPPCIAITPVLSTKLMVVENTQNNALAKAFPCSNSRDYALWEVIENENSWVPIPVTSPSETGYNEATKKTQKAAVENKQLHRLVLVDLAHSGCGYSPERSNVNFKSLLIEWDTYVMGHFARVCRALEVKTTFKIGIKRKKLGKHGFSWAFSDSVSISQLNDKGFVDSGCSRHMTGNIAHLSNFKDFDGGYVTFRGGAYGSRINIARHLKLDDHDGITSIPNSEIFEQLALMGYHTDSDNPKKTAWEQFSSNIATAVICLATNRRFNFSRLIFEHMMSNISSPHMFLMYPRFIQICLDMQRKQLQQHSRTYPVPSISIKVFNNMKRPTKGYSGQEVDLFPTMLNVFEPSTSPSRITSSPSHSHEPSIEHSLDHTTDAVSFPSPTQPTQPSPRAEQHISTPHDSPLHVVHSHGSDGGSLQLIELTNLVTKLSERIGVLEDDLKKTKQTYSAAVTKLILRVKKLEAKVKAGTTRKGARVQEKASTETEPIIQEVTPTEVIQDQGSSEKGNSEVSTAGATKGTASEVPVVSTAEENISTAGRTVTYRRRSEEERTRKDKGKAIMTELAINKWNEEQKAQIARDEEIARQWDEEEGKSYVAQARRNMVKYLKNQGNYKISDFKGMSYNEIRPIFEKKDVASLSTSNQLWNWNTCVLYRNFLYYQSSEELVKDRYSTSRPEGYDLMLWGDLHTLFEPDEESEI